MPNDFDPRWEVYPSRPVAPDPVYEAFKLVFGGGGLPGASGFGRLAPAARAMRPAAAVTRAARAPGLAGTAEESALSALGVKLGQSGTSQPGAIAEAGAAGKLTRGWPGIYKGGVEAGRTQPKSYANPRLFELEDASPELLKSLKELGIGP